jgi:ribonuclease Y
MNLYGIQSSKKGEVEVDFLINMAVAMAGLLLGFILRLIWSKFSEGSAGKDAAAIMENARKEAERIMKEAELTARDEAFRQKESCENEIASSRKELRNIEKRLIAREETVNERANQVEKKDSQLSELKEKLEQEHRELQHRSSELEELVRVEQRTLHEISGLTKQQATEALLAKMEEELEEDTVRLIEKSLSKAKAEAAQKARDILAMAVQRCAVEHTADNVVSTIDIPSDEMKGRIIGREGRNIRTFEKATGIDVIVDDTPGVIVVSGFNVMRREIARRAMEKLILDGRIHPARIEEVVEATKKEMQDIIIEAGKQAAYEANVHNLHPIELELLGKMRFQMAMGQNLIQHTLEVVQLVTIMASELNLDAQLARRCALLHDMGRASDENTESNHAEAGASIAKRCKEPLEVVNAIAAHHEGVPARSLYAILLQIAHSISLDRPGSRKPFLERHLKRLQRMEDLALSFPGVETVYAIQAGREIRCIVNAKEIDDKKAMSLCRSVARKIEEELTYPGEIKITVVRETRIIEYAK